MRSERFKTITKLFDNGSFTVLHRQHRGELEYVTASVERAILFQLTTEELVDAVSGYMGCGKLMVNMVVNSNLPIPTIELTMRTINAR